MTEGDELTKKLSPRLPTTWSPDQLREHFEKMKHYLPAFTSQYLNKPAGEQHYDRGISDDVGRTLTKTDTLELMKVASQRYEKLFSYRPTIDDIDEETLSDDPMDEELEVKVSIKRLNDGHVLIRAGCQERVVHNLKELYSMLRALIRTNVPKTLFERK